MNENLTTQDVENLLSDLVETMWDENVDEGDFCDNENALLRNVQSFSEAGVLTNNNGLVLTLGDGSEFQLTLLRSR